MPNIENRDPSGSVKAGTTLSVTNASSENEAILAVENYLRVNKGEGLEMSLPTKGDDGSYLIKLEDATAAS
ncbi:hypothetical protein MUK70_02820 [Dyadobacter chenwenxiniae]|uniref:Uncharacterized protein n=1 Tax=Dyadobacter chenwenxiniae TaxID=2906456 RepID=A0A9X1PJ26_9BACT|nr:hypothetical protein [Dyadobacter chenwenxiniae]MCF0048844.1 hypothetical protein [Dyadobacter chenwenxiniae]MCF0062317.1 hypothetical protein [Dyadobacter chenwenxiniae]UON83927.1 hypothetical protein MUK70_02820 [Dyadobacter chenwenxiniae]